MKLLRQELHTLTGAYALDAVDQAERDRFEHHLHRCQSCEHEVRGLRETATRLAMAVARTPPPQLKERVLAAAARTRQLPPAVEEQPRPQPRNAWWPRVAVGLAAAGVAVAVILGFALAGTQRQLAGTQHQLGSTQHQLAGTQHQLGSTQHQLGSATAQERAITTILNAPGARILTARVSVGGTATVVVAARLHKMIFTASGLPPLAAAKIYQLWLLGPPRTRSAGLLPLPIGGRTAPVLAAGIRRGDSVGVTIEPAGGTLQPTTTPILVIPLFS